MNESNKNRRAERLRDNPRHRLKEAVRAKAYQKQNREKLNAYAVLRRQTNINAKIASRVMSRINDALRCADASKRFRTADLLGCTIAEFKDHLNGNSLKE